MTTPWYEVGSVVRSRLHYTTWVPVVPDEDYGCFLHAGPQRAVRRWLAEHVGGGDRLRWVRISADEWSLEAHDDAA